MTVPASGRLVNHKPGSYPNLPGADILANYGSCNFSIFVHTYIKIGTQGEHHSIIQKTDAHSHLNVINMLH
jgi:hypothetical protein